MTENRPHNFSCLLVASALLAARSRHLHTLLVEALATLAMADATDGRQQRRDSVGSDHMLFAVPKKGRLHDKIIQLLKGAGLKWVRVSDRIYTA